MLGSISKREFMKIGLITFTPEELAGLTSYYSVGNRTSHGKTENLLIFGKVGPTHCKGEYHLSEGGVVCFYKHGSKEDSIYIAKLGTLKRFKKTLVTWAKYRKTKLPEQFSDLDVKVGNKQIKQLSLEELGQLMDQLAISYDEKDTFEILECLRKGEM